MQFCITLLYPYNVITKHCRIEHEFIVSRKNEVYVILIMCHTLSLVAFQNVILYILHPVYDNNNYCVNILCSRDT